MAEEEESRRPSINLNSLNCFLRCCNKDEPEDDEAHFKYKAKKVPNSAGIYMSPRNVDDLPDSPGPSNDARDEKKMRGIINEDIREQIQRCLNRNEGSPSPTREELLELVDRMANIPREALPHSAAQDHRDSGEPSHTRRGKGRRKLTKSRAYIISQMRKNNSQTTIIDDDDDKKD